MKAKFIPTLLIAFCFALNAVDQKNGKLRFAKIISDNMVLQQQKPMTIWGWAKPGAAVNVTLTQDATLGQAAANKFESSQGCGCQVQGAAPGKTQVVEWR